MQVTELQQSENKEERQLAEQARRRPSKWQKCSSLKTRKSASGRSRHDGEP